MSEAPNPYKDEMLRLKERVNILESALAQASRIQLQWQHTVEQLKQAQQSLTESRERFLTLFEHSTSGMLVADMDGAIQIMNPEFLHMLGYDEESQPLNILEIFPQCDELVPELHDRRSRRRSGLLRHLDEVTLIRADGAPLVVSLSLIRVIQHNAPMLLISAQDLSRHMQEREELQATIAQRANRLLKLSQALVAAREAIVIVNPDGVIEYANPAYFALWGYPEEEIVGSRAAILKSGEQDDAYYAEMWQTIMAGDVWEKRVVNRCKDGQLKAATLSISPVLDEQGHLINFVGIYRDLTRQEQLARQVFQTQKMEAVRTLVSGISHEFNNILAGMTGNLYLAKMLYPNDQEICNYLDNAEEQGFRAAEMIQKLMTFARKDWVDEKDIDLNVVVRDLVHMGRLAVPEHINLEIQTSQQPLIIHADTAQIQQLLLHLVQNAHDALKHAAHGKITIELVRWTANAEFLARHTGHAVRQYARLTVRDNGIGIRDKDLPHIFEPFYTSKDTGEGTGLGLSAVFGAIERMGGSVDVHSKPGDTRFDLYIPLSQQAEPETTGDEIQPTTDVEPAEQARLLLVDDEPEVLKITSKILNSLGYHVVTATDGLEAVRYYEAHHEEIDLVVTDIIMPQLGGIESVVRMRKLRPGLPVVFISGYDQEYFDENVGEDERTRLIIKPLRIGELSKIIRQMLAL